MKKMSLFLLCLMLIIGTIATVAVSAEETELTGSLEQTGSVEPTEPTEDEIEQWAKELVVSRGYQARIEDYHGVRSLFELDHALLAKLETAGKKVTIGILIGANVSEGDGYTNNLVVTSKSVVNDVFYRTGEDLAKKCYDNDTADTKYEFVYAVTFGVKNDDGEIDKVASDAKAKAKKDVDLAFRAYVTIGEGENAETYYINQYSASDLGTVASLEDVATALAGMDNNCYPFLQRLLDDTLSEAEINGVSIDKYSIYANGNVEAAKALSAAVEKATGYKLPIVNKLDSDCFVIEVNEELNSTYKVAVEDAKITISVKNAYFASYAVGKLAIAGAENAYSVTTVEKGVYVYDTLYVGYDAETGSFKDAYLIVDFANSKDEPHYLYAADGVTIVPNTATYERDAFGNKYVAIVGAGYVDITNLFDVHTYPQNDGGNEKYTVEFVALSDAEPVTDTSVTSKINLWFGFSHNLVQRAGRFAYAYGPGTATEFYRDYDETYHKSFIRNLNTYSVVYDTKDADGDGEDVINIIPYYNAKPATRYTTTELPDTTFKMATIRNRIQRGDGTLNLYEIRVYSRMLEADEVAQNHFADIAKLYQLDVSAFCKENTTVKEAVYKAFSGIALSGTTKEAAQKTLDFAIYDTVTYGEGVTEYVNADANGNFKLPVPEENKDLFLGYYDEAKGEYATNEFGEKLEDYVLTGDVTLVAKYINKYKVTYVWDDDTFTEEVREDAKSLKVPDNDLFLGYFLEDGTQVTDAKGNIFEDFKLTGDITVKAEYKNVYDTLYVGYNANTDTFDGATLILDFFGGTANYVFGENAVTKFEKAEIVENYLKITAANGKIYLDPAAVDAAFGDEGDYTVDLVASHPDNTVDVSWYLYTGVTNRIRHRPDLTPTRTDFAVSGSASLRHNGEEWNKVNMYTFAVDYEKSVAYYLNGGLLADDGVVTAWAENTHDYIMSDTAGARFYAVRIYNTVLSAEEIAQNHFADIAKYFQLDVSAFRAADDTTKTAVYTAFSGITLSETTKKDARTLLENTLTPVAE